MGFIQKDDVAGLLQDSGFAEEVVKALVEHPKAMANLADDIADKLEDVLEDDPELKKRIVDAAMTKEEFKNKIIGTLVHELK